MDGAGKGRSVLVVDDEPAIVDLLTDVLADEGYRVRRAGDGALALAAVERERPDAIIADVMMPRLDGFRLTAELRRRGLRIPTILMSAAGEPPGGPGLVFVAKPFDLDHLLGLVERALGAS